MAYSNNHNLIEDLKSTQCDQESVNDDDLALQNSSQFSHWDNMWRRGSSSSQSSNYSLFSNESTPTPHQSTLTPHQSTIADMEASNSFLRRNSSTDSDNSIHQNSSCDVINPKELVKSLLNNPNIDTTLLWAHLNIRYEEKMANMELESSKDSCVKNPLQGKSVNFCSKKASSKVCKFCRNNNEEEVYHDFKDSSGRVVCPILSKHVCEMCGATGGDAHTRKYCPQNPLTQGMPEQRGFPPGMIPKDVHASTLRKLRLN